MFSRRVALLLVSVALLGASASAQDKTQEKNAEKPETKQVESPVYKNWAKFKSGTYVTVIATTEAEGKKTEQKMWYTLMVLGDDTLTVENETAQPENVKFKLPPTKLEYAKMVEATDKTEASIKAGKPGGVTDEGTETLKVGDKEYKCTWYKFRINTLSGPVSNQLWVCDDVPGRMVKMKSESRAATTVSEVTEIVKK
jgi:hypothetical protein